MRARTGTKAIGAIGFSGKEVCSALSRIGDGANFSCVSLSIDGYLVCSGEIEEINFIDGGFMVQIKEPKESDPVTP